MSSVPADGALSPLRYVWRWVKGFLIFLIVAFHLIVLTIRNPLDLWYDEIKATLQKRDLWGERIKQADNFTYKYTNLVGLEQRWSMFGAPVARRAYFLTFRIDLSDGSSDSLKAVNEVDPQSYFRFGGWQDRKLEEYLCFPGENLKENSERGLWEAHAREVIRRWQRSHPDDSRSIVRVVFLRRYVSFPKIGSDPSEFGPPEDREAARFDAQGRVLP